MSSGSRKETVKNIVASKEFRDFYTETYLRKNLPFQMRTMRSERNWSQTVAAESLGKRQNALSRLESPRYGKLTIQTLLEIARGYDVGLIVKFVPYSRLLKEYEDVSFDALSSPSPTEEFPDELNALEAWVHEKEDDGFWEAKEEVNSNVIHTDRFASEPIANPTKFTYQLPFDTGQQTVVSLAKANQESNNDVSTLDTLQEQESGNSYFSIAR